MKVQIFNCNIEVIRSNRVIFTPDKFTSTLSNTILGGRDGSLKTVNSITTSELTQLPFKNATISIENTGYPNVDGFATFALYDSSGNFIVAGSDGDNKELDTKNYPTATQFRFSWYNSSAARAQVTFIKNPS